MKRFNPLSGQALLELLIGITLGGIFIAGAVSIIVLSLRVDFQSSSTQVASELAQSLNDQVRSVAANDWRDVDSLSLETAYHLNYPDGYFFTVDTGSEVLDIDGISYTRNFKLYSVQRDSITNEIVSSGGVSDPSTLDIQVTVSWNNNGEEETLVFNSYTTRYHNLDYVQVDWSGGAGFEGPVTEPVTTYFTELNFSANESLFITDLSTSTVISEGTNIDSEEKYVWNDVLGWIDFFETNTVTVSSTRIFGYALSPNLGFVALDCSTSPIGDICDQSNFAITHDDDGILKGAAWNDQIGWISFNCETTNNCLSQGGLDYGVTIDGSGYFNGWGWNDVTGWISFNCDNSFIGNTCGLSNYKLRTNWNAPVSEGSLISSIIDTGMGGGVAYNFIMWQGTAPANTAVLFRFASSNCSNGATNAPICDQNLGWGGEKTSGEGAFIGPGGDENTYYQPAGPNNQVNLSRLYHNNHRYFRYEVIAHSDQNRSSSPEIYTIIVNWSR